MYRIYQIKPGDTIESIASNLGINPEVLLTLNGLSLNTNLAPNSFIVVPSANNYFDRYTVKDGDTMYNIARMYNIDPSALLTLNGLNENDYIYKDQEILVPKPNTGFYVTKEQDTLTNLTSNLNLPLEEIIRQNKTIYLMPDQLIVYKK